MTIRFYSYTDPGAPAHPNATRGSMAALLRACLVDGYFLGEDVTAGAGWEEVYPEANNYAAFRSLVGARQIYQIDDNQTDADVAYIRAGESISAVDSAVQGQWGGDYFGKQYSSSYANWHVIADEKTCYVILQSYGGNIIHGFGEFNSCVPDDPYNSFTSGHSMSTGLPQATTYCVGMHYANRLGYSGRIEAHRTCTGHFAGNGVLVGLNSVYYPGGQNYQSSPSSANVGLGFYTYPAFITMDENQENGLRLVRGNLRGVHIPIAYRPKNHLEDYVDTATGKTLKCIHFSNYSSSSYYGCFMFDMTGPW